MAGSTIHNQDFRRFFGADGVARRCIEQVLDIDETVRIATAYFEASGYQVLQDILSGKRIYLLVGRNEGGRDSIREVLNEFEEELASGDMVRRTRAMRLMREALEAGMMTVGVGEEAFEQAASVDARYLYHHAKLYIAGTQAAVVGSANFSHQGLIASREAGIRVEEQEDVAFFVHRFDEYFSRAQPINQELIQKLVAWLKEYDPYQIYARALLELYGLPEEDAPASLPSLAPYQRAVVSNVLAALQSHRGAFLIASTGLGKTIIAAHVVAYLRMQDEIDSVLVASPAGIKEMWRRTMHAAKTVSEEFSYHTLSGKDRQRDSGVGILERELRYVDDKSLIILDESHHLRNEEDTEGEIRIRNQRVQNAVREKQARVLLMTATPYSKDCEDVNNQLRLMPKPATQFTTQIGARVSVKNWRIDQLNELPELPPCTVLTTPDVVQHFGYVDDRGERFVEFAPGVKRYFPRRLILHTVRYDNPLDDLLVELLTSDLLHKKRLPGETDKHQFALFDRQILEGTLARRGRRDPLFESHVLHQFCSSLARVQVLCQKLETGDFQFSFEHQERLRNFIRANGASIRRAAQPRNDVKLDRLVEIIKQAQGQKVTIFCHYIETAKKLKENLQKRLTRLRVETTAEKKSPDLDRILQAFAPVANEVPQEERNLKEELQALVATGALMEGFNLQDSAILVNYDLPWTVLQLAQRMGRILRPWDQPREIHIYNFVPTTMDHPRLRHARRWHSRLHERGEQHRSFSQIPVFVRQDAGGKVEEGFEMERLARELYVREDESIELEGVLNFIENADALKTSSFYKDLVKIPNQAEIERLPAGIRSARVWRGKKRLFVLFRHSSRLVVAGLFNFSGRLVKDGDRREVVMQVIRCEVDEPKAPARLYPEDDVFDAWIERSRQTWAEIYGIPPHRLKIICAMALIPEEVS